MTHEEIAQIIDKIETLIDDNTEIIAPDNWNTYVCFVDGGRTNIMNGIEALLSSDKLKLPLDVEI